MLARLCFFLLLFINCSWVNANNANPVPAKELASVKTEIEALSNDVKLNKASKETLFKQLKKQSLAVSELNKELKALAQKMRKQSAELDQLAIQVQKHHKTQDEQLAALNKQIRSAYINGQPSVMKVLLNQENPATLSRSTIYYRYFHQARQEQLINLAVALENLTSDQKRLFAAQKQQKQLYAEQEKKQGALKEKAQQREVTLAILDKKISGQDARLELLREQEKSLQAVLSSLNKPKKSEHTVTSRPKEQSAFAERVGKLQWPVKGKLLAHYGSPRNLGKLTWQGIMISASSGDNVVAAAPGRVVFADWLRGFGLLLIIDHGDQYMTLYGNNETLLKEVGDEVRTGELIAQSGENDVRQQAGLYFEMRHKGSPTNPMKWLSKQS